MSTTGSVPGVTSAMVARANESVDGVSITRRAIWWLQSIPAENGRVALMRRYRASGEQVQATGPAVDVGGSIHAYGGGVYAAGEEGFAYVDRRDGRVYAVDNGGAVRAITEPRPLAKAAYGDLVLVGGELLAVRETNEGDQLVVLDGGDLAGRVIARTEGFFGAPRVSRGRLAWLRWDRNRMPWDGTELWVADFPGGEVGDAYRIAGGVDESVLEPQWDPDGGLTFVSDRTGFWNLYRYDGTAITAVAPMPADVAAAPWELGYASYAHLGSGRTVMTVHDGPRQRLVIASGGATAAVELPFTSFKPYLAAEADQLVAIAASFATAPQVISIDLAGGIGWRPVTPPDLSYTGVGVTLPDQTRIDGPGGPLNVLIYPPRGAPHDWMAPLVVRAHPGPTASMTARLDGQVQFLCSHGFAVADVDYRGSTGYSRAFRRSLYGRWGTADVEDCAAVAAHLITAGHTRIGQVFITGASAGGFTALHAVSRDSVFAGAVARSAIVDPGRWSVTAPRWQRPHAAELAGPAGAVRAEGIARPVLLIHGFDDHVALLADVVALAEALTAADRTVELLILGESGHDLGSEADNARALDAELAFYRARLQL